MEHTKQLAKHLREVHFGGNWTWVNLKDTLEGITWQQATTKVHSFNTIVALVYHINYYVGAITRVLKNEPIKASDKYAFDHPPVESEEDWQKMIAKTLKEGEGLAELIEQAPDERLDEIFVDEKYGNQYRNFLGLIEHTHYHLGQIVILRKLISAQ